MRPYYEDGLVTLFHGAWQDSEPSGFDLLLTDPPYGIKRAGKPVSTSSHGGHKGYADHGWDDEPPTPEDFARLLGMADDWVIWGANYFSPNLPPGPGWLLWDKGQRIDQADGELAASSRKGPLRILTLNRAAIARDGAVHPTQKPRLLFSWCLSFFPDAKTLVDPYAGSGTALVEAKARGIRAVGFERVESYCEAIALRLAQDNLFAETL